MSGYYRYYDTPDGKDYFKKEYFLLRRAQPFGSILACIDVMACTKPCGLIPVATRYLQVMSRPIIGVTIWNTTTYLSVHLRGKDDPWNHALSVIPVGIYLKNFLPATAVWCLCTPFMIVLYAAKWVKLEYPETPLFKETTTFRDDVDNSLYADYFSFIRLKIMEKNWVTIEDAVKKGLVASEEEAKEKKLTNYKEDGQARGLVRVADGSENHTLLI